MKVIDLGKLLEEVELRPEEFPHRMVVELARIPRSSEDQIIVFDPAGTELAIIPESFAPDRMRDATDASR